MRYLFSLFLFYTLLFGVDLKLNVENNNIARYQKTAGMVDYNRLRLYLDLYDDRWQDFSAKVILDNENVYSFKSSVNQNQSSIYRAYLKYAGEKHMFILGRQRVPFGVGRIYNPIDVFNPIDITEIETDERKGTQALRYEYAINMLSSFDITISKEKQAFRLKSFLDTADIALILVKDQTNDLQIVGIEAEGELLDTDVTLRSEGGYFYHSTTHQSYFDYILGAEYGFENSLIILTEFHDNTALHAKQLAFSISYQPNPLWYLNLINVCSLEDSSMMIIPSLSYSLSDESDLQFGLFLGIGADTTLFGKLENRIYIRHFIHF